MADTSADAAAHVEQLRRLLTGDVDRLTRVAAAAGKRETLDVARQLGPLSHMGRRGVRLSAGYDIDHQGHTVTIRLRPPGAWLIAEQKSAAHTIAPRRRRARAADRPVAVAADSWGHPAPAVQHPGGRGRRGIARAFAKAREAMPKAIHDEQVRQMRQIFRG